MQATTQAPLTERLMNPHVGTVNPHEVAKELTELHRGRNSDGVLKLRDAYLIGQGRLYPVQTVDEIRSVVDENLMMAAGLADVVASCGYEASGQLHVKPRLDGPVAQFYQESTGINP